VLVAAPRRNEVFRKHLGEGAEMSTRGACVPQNRKRRCVITGLERSHAGYQALRSPGHAADRGMKRAGAERHGRLGSEDSWRERGSASDQFELLFPWMKKSDE
jgi:hypothetical protein